MIYAMLMYEVCQIESVQPAMAYKHFNNRRLGDHASPGSLVLELVDRHGAPGKSRKGRVRPTALTLLSVEDLQMAFKGLESPDKVSFNDRLKSRKLADLDADVSAEVWAAFQHLLLRAVGETSLSAIKTLLTDMEEDDKQRLLQLAQGHAADFVCSLDAVKEALKSIASRAVGCFYHDVLLADGTQSSAYMVSDLMDTIKVHGLLKTYFKHDSRTFDRSGNTSGQLNGGTIVCNDVDQMMVSFPVVSSAMPVYFYVSAVSMKSGTCSYSCAAEVAADLVNRIAARLLTEDPDEVHEYDNNYASVNKLFSAQLLFKCFESLMVRPHASMAASFSHRPESGMPTHFARQFVAFTSLAPVASDDDTVVDIVCNRTPVRRRQMPLPFVLRCN